MPCAVADLTSTLERAVMNYYAPNWVRYDSLQLSNPAKIEDFPAEAKISNLSAGYNVQKVTLLQKSIYPHSIQPQGVPKTD